jgi:hypothetical protein
VKARIYTWRAASKRPFSHLGGPDSEPRSPGKGGLVISRTTLGSSKQVAS